MTTPTAFMPPRYVAEPAPAPPRFGLFSVVVSPDVTSEDHWESGVRWAGSACEPAAIVGMGCTDQGDPVLFGMPKTARDGQAYPEGSPFAVIGSSSCSPIGGQWTSGEDRAMAHLLLGAERAVERAVYLGEAGNVMTLVDPSTVDVTPTPGTAVSVTAGVAVLESYLAANHHSVGVIHANPREVLKMAGGGILTTVPTNSVQPLQTHLGTLVASEGGMSGAVGPDGSAAPAGTHWMYATGRPQLRRSAPQFIAGGPAGALNRSTNDMDVYVEQIFVVAWECVTAAVLVNEADEATAVAVTVLPPVVIAGTQRTTDIKRYNGTVDAHGTHNIVAGKRSYSIAVMAAAGATPTLDGKPLPVGWTGSYTAPGADTLEAAVLITAAGDDVLYTEVV